MSNLHTVSPPIENDDRRPIEWLGPSVLIPSFFMLIIAGFLFFHFGAATVRGNELSRERIVFTIVNAITLTGFQQVTNVNDYTWFGRFLSLILTVGGMVFTFLASGFAVVRIARMRFTDSQVVRAAGISILIAAAMGAITAIGSRQNVFAGLYQSTSAFGNSGLFFGTLPASTSSRATLLLLPLVIAGGLGLPVLMEMFDWIRGARPLSIHSQTVLKYSAAFYLLGVVGLALMQWPGPANTFAMWRQPLMLASRESINARSAGLAFDYATYWPRVVQWFTIGLMIVGAAPGGTGGGVKVTAMAAISRGCRQSLRRQNPGRLFGMAVVWLGLYLLMLGASTIALLVTEPQMPADRLFFLASSALGNVGLSHDPISVSDNGLYVLAATMIVGRLTPVLILWWIVDTTPEAELAIA